jgi:hypothetical protein
VAEEMARRAAKQRVADLSVIPSGTVAKAATRFSIG